MRWLPYICISAFSAFVSCNTNNGEQEQIAQDKTLADTPSIGRFVYFDKGKTLHTSKSCYVIAFADSIPSNGVVYLDTAEIRSVGYVCPHCVNEDEFLILSEMAKRHANNKIEIPGF